MASSDAGEDRRLAALYRYDVLDTLPERSFDRITLLAKALFQVPIALVSLVDRNRQWFKSRQGLDATETTRDISFCRYTVEQDEPLVIRDATQDARTRENPLVLGDPHIRFYAGAPLITNCGQRVGSLCVIDRVARDVTDEQLTVLQELARIVVEELELRTLAYSDCLTGALTRRAFNEIAAHEVLRSRRHQRPVSFAVLDLDHFKRVNDTYGHAVGDAVLIRSVEAWRAELRGCDTIGRMGGEEFAVVLPECDLAAAHLAMERARTALANLLIETCLGPLKLTTSIGVTEWAVTDQAVEQALQRADRALYRAKQGGRNRVATWAADSFVATTKPAA